MRDCFAIYLSTISWCQICDSIQTSYSDLWPRLCNKTFGPVFMLRLLIQRWFVACAMHAFHPMSGHNCNRYYYLLLTSFVRLFVYLFVCACALIILSEVWEAQDVIHPLMNHALISDHSSRPFVYPAGLSRVMPRPSSTRLCYQAYCLR